MLPSWLAFVIAFILSSLLVPSVRASVFASDDILEVHEKGISLSTVAVRAYPPVSFISAEVSYRAGR
jgi:hypothetical protein